MGHTRLGAIPKTRKWNELVEQVAGYQQVEGQRAIVHRPAGCGLDGPGDGSTGKI